MTSNVIVKQINGGPIGVKNAIINGNFGINQRGVSGTVTLSAGAYGHDRWKAGASGCTYTFATSNNVTTITISSGSLIQVVEDINLLTDTYTLSWTGTAQGKIGAGSFAGSGVTGSVTGGSNLNIEFNTGTVSLVQLERGSVATPFEFRSIGQELALCQRYYERLTLPNNTWFGSGYWNTTTQGILLISFAQTMRIAPTALETSGTASHYGIRYAGGVAVNATVPQFLSATTSSITLSSSISGSFPAGAGSIGISQAATFLGWGAEL